MGGRGDGATSVLENSSFSTDRRDFLRAAGASAAIACFGSAPAIGAVAAEEPSRKTSGPSEPRVAAIFTEFTYRSHAHVILENFLEPYLFNGQATNPGCKVVSFYADQFPQGEMGRSVAETYGIPIYPTIAQALTLGGENLAVDAVLSIGEHGTYPVNEKGQMEYPRKRFFDEIVAVFERSGRVVPLFNDKHLSFRWDWSKEMVDTARRLKIPFMAGSSTPLAERRPAIEMPRDAEISEAVCVHGGPIESYDFHALEILQSFVEFRKGGETGVSKVEFLTGEPLWRTLQDGKFEELAHAALERELGAGQPPLRSLAESLASKEQEPDKREPPHGVLVEFRDGLRGLALSVGSRATRWNFACRLKGEAKPFSTALYTGPWNNRNLFKALSHAIQEHFRSGQAPYPVERTLLVSGVLDFAMESRLRQRPIDTPELDFGYVARDFKPFREMGASWKIITEGTPQPAGVDPGGIESAK